MMVKILFGILALTKKCMKNSLQNNGKLLSETACNIFNSFQLISNFRSIFCSKIIVRLSHLQIPFRKTILMAMSSFGMNFTGDQVTSSAHHEFLFKQEIPVMVSPPLVISNVWNLDLSRRRTYPLVHSATFYSNDLPGVEFGIFAAVTDATKLIVHLTKSVADPANVTFKITFSGTILKNQKIDDWTNNRSIEEVVTLPSHGQSTHVIEFELTWHGFVKKPNKCLPINLHRHLKHLFETGDLADFTIAIGDEEISTHKAILASQSSKFLGMFKSGMRESVDNRLEISDIGPEIMKKVIEYMYTGEIDSKLDVNVLLSILAVADEYGIIDLKNLCEHVLCTKITVNNALEILEGADLYGAQKLLEETISLMVYNKKAIVHLPDFKHLYGRKPEILLSFFLRVAET